MAPYVDVDVEPLSDAAIHRFATMRGVHYSGDELLARIERHAMLRGKRGVDHVPERDENVETRMVLVIHHDGRHLPTMYGVPYASDFDTFSESLEAMVPLKPHERFIYGWYHLGIHPGYIGGYLSSSDLVPREDHRHYVLTAWRTVVSDTYVALDCIWNNNHIAPPILVHPNVDGSAIINALCRYVPSPAAFQGCSTFPSHSGARHPEYSIHRLGVMLDPFAQGMAQHPRGSLYTRHESALPLTLVHEWCHAGRQKYYEHCRADASPDGIRATLLHSPAYAYAYTVDVIDRTTIRITTRTARGQLRLLPATACPNRERWFVSLEMAAHSRDIYGTFEFIMDVLRMDQDVPLASPPSTLRASLQRHQLQNLSKMIENERTTFRSLMYTPIPSSNGDRLFYIDPRSNEIATHHITVSTHSCGGFLSDEVGLGKTLSVIALCVSHPPGPTIGCGATLVVCPPSIIGQWAREIAQYAPSLVTLVYHGKKKTDVTMDAIAGADIVLTTYTTYVQHIEFLRPILWCRAVFDESHTMSERFAALAPHAPRRWCITATPFNNIYRQFRALHVHVRPYEFGVGTMYYALEPIFIRHDKDQTDIALPPLIEELVPVEFATAAEESLYARAHEHVVKELDATVKKLYTMKLNLFTHILRLICTGGEWTMASLFRGHTSSLPGAQQPDYSLVAPHGEEDVCPVCMNVYDQPTTTTCNHWFCSDCIATALIRTGAKCPMCRCPQQQSQLRLGVLYGESPPEPPSVADMTCDAVKCASKQAKLLDLLQSLHGRDPTSKALVFCHTSAMIPELMRFLKANGLKCRSIHGGMPALQRGNAIRAFQTDPKTTVFVLSIRSAAAGINLTAANHVIFMGPSVNRAGHHQAIGRAHRFGQHRPVTVHHMYIKGTIEEELHRAFSKPGSWSGAVWDRVVRHTVLH